MREIKFRVWDNIENKFLTGWETNQLVIRPLSGRVTDGATTPDVSLSQYTGLKDKNGIAIYDGDILKFDHLHNYANELQVVSMDKFMWGTDEYSFQEMIERNYKFEVIDNIYVNKNSISQQSNKT